MPTCYVRVEDGVGLPVRNDRTEFDLVTPIVDRGLVKSKTWSDVNENWRKYKFMTVDFAIQVCRLPLYYVLIQATRTPYYTNSSKLGRTQVLSLANSPRRFQTTQIQPLLFVRRSRDLSSVYCDITPKLEFFFLFFFSPFGTKVSFILFI